MESKAKNGIQSEERIAESSIVSLDLQLSRKGLSPAVMLHIGICVVLRA
jgi:hypothetical protein